MKPSLEHAQERAASPTDETEPKKRLRSSGGLLVFSIIALLLAGAIGYQVYETRKLSQQVASMTSRMDAGDSEADSLINTAPPMPHSLPTGPSSGDALDLDHWDPRAELQRMQREMNQLFGTSFSRFHTNPQLGTLFDSRTFTPSIDVEETQDAYLIRVDVPGASESDISVEVEGNVLRIRGETNHEDEGSESSGQIVRKERFEGHFERAIALSSAVDSTKMTSQYENGVLTITLPKEVQSGDS